MSLIENRLAAASRLMTDAGIMCVAIDDEEVSEARRCWDNFFRKRLVSPLFDRIRRAEKQRANSLQSHEYALFYGKSTDATPGSLELTEKRMARYPKQDEKGRFAWMNLIRTRN